MILISGVQVMKGYLNDEERTKKAIIEINEDKYYITGDKGRVDSDGFLTIVDRYSRFAKLGGEMISLGLIEEKIKTLLPKEEIDVVVTSVSDEKKGEKIVVLLSSLDEKELEIIKNRVKENFDNNLMVPSLYKIVSEVPKLGSGKTDFSRAKTLANQLV